MAVPGHGKIAFGDGRKMFAGHTPAGRRAQRWVAFRNGFQALASERVGRLVFGLDLEGK